MRQRATTLTSLTAFVLFAAVAAPMPAAADLFKVENAGKALVFYPTEEAKGFELTVTGPCNYEYRMRTDKAEIVFELPKDAMDGLYNYSIDAVPIIDPEIMKILEQARVSGDDKRVRELCREGALPTGPTNQSGFFSVVERQIVLDTRSEKERAERDEGEKAADLDLEPQLPSNAELADRFQAADGPAASPGECLWARMKPAGLNSGR